MWRHRTRLPTRTVAHPRRQPIPRTGDTVSRPRDIGTRAETAIVRTARQFGFPHAERKPLYGSRDQADVALCPGVLIESKAGKAAETASDNQIGEWMGEAEASRVNAGAAFCFLVTKRKG